MTNKKIEASTVGFACICSRKCYEATEEKEKFFYDFWDIGDSQNTYPMGLMKRQQLKETCLESMKVLKRGT